MMVIYKNGNIPTWASQTPGHPNSRLLLQNDGDLVIYQNGNIPIWATGTLMGCR